MRILVVGQHYYPEQFRVTDICEALVKRGHDVTMLTGLPNYPEGKIYKGYRFFGKRHENINGVNVIRSWLVPRGKNKAMLFLNYLSFMFFGSLKALFMKKQYDVVISYQTSPVFMAVPAVIYKKLTGKKLLFYCLDIWPECFAAVTNYDRNSRFYKLLIKMSSWIYKKADILAVSSKSFECYLNNMLKTDMNYEYLPQYAEEMFSSEPLETHTEKPDVNLLFAGNLGYMQSIDTIILAAEELKGNKNIKWHIVGDGSEKERLIKLADDFNLLNKSVFFYGKKPLENMPEYYAMADAMLITIKSNSFASLTLPGKLQTYLAYGKPVIGAVCGEAEKVIKESEAGLLGATEDYHKLAENVEKFSNSRENWMKYSKNARDYYKNNFSKDKIIDRICDMLERLI